MQIEASTGSFMASWIFYKKTKQKTQHTDLQIMYQLTSETNLLFGHRINTIKTRKWRHKVCIDLHWAGVTILSLLRW